MTTPLVTAIVPTYNRPNYCSEAIESVLAQTLTDFELIVVDDGSTDDTPQRLALYRDRIRILRQDNAGVSAARNTAIQAARGRYLAFLDHDDLWLPEKLATVIPALESTPAAGLAYSAVRATDEAGHPRETSPASRRVASGQIFTEVLLRRIRISTSSLVVRRDAIEEVGPYDPTLPVAQDFDLHLRLTRRYPAVGIPEPLAVVRFTPGSGGQDRIRAHQDVITVLERTWNTIAQTPDAPPAREIHRLLSHRYRKLGKRLRATGDRPAARAALAQSWRLRPANLGAAWDWLRT